MRNKGRFFSYADLKHQKHRVRRISLWILFFFLVYTTLTSLVFSMGVIENDTMAPNLRPGDRIVFSSYNIYTLFPGLSFDRLPLSISRGNIVMINTHRGETPGLMRRFMDRVLRFVSAQRLSLVDQNEFLFVKRVIGLPGDEITMTNFIIRVRTRENTFSLSEFEVTEQDYILEIPQVPALWDSSLPFSGNMDSIILGENEIFVLSDDRSNTNDSRTWGPVPITSLRGRALFRYWPLNRLGRP